MTHGEDPVHPVPVASSSHTKEDGTIERAKGQGERKEEEEEEVIVLDTSTSRGGATASSRGRSSTAKKRRSLSSQTQPRHGDDSGKVNRLRRKLDRVRELRTTEEEEARLAHEANTSARLAAAEELIAHWKGEAERAREQVTQQAVQEQEQQTQEEVERLKMETLALQRQVSSLQHDLQEAQQRGTTETQDEVAQLRARLVEQTKMCTFFECMTSLTPKLEGDRVMCTVTHPITNRHLSFGLTFKGDEVEYAQMGKHMPGTTLPYYLDEEITFDKTQAPIFFSKVLGAVFSREG
eukprot:TRINITY_DN21390_c0_g1_i1.p1 TRINITY_DN21390_c0_g1~~TRINITY_DN21390_c0_g1_i1.p1  ORF type:complete len:317 (-),score=68.89 TRINITY_DN21390_c0_g1_i1:126-1007(-)